MGNFHVDKSKIKSFPREYQQREHLSAKNCTIFKYIPDYSEVYSSVPEHHYDISGMAIIDRSNPDYGIDLQVCFFESKRSDLGWEYTPVEYCHLTEHYTNYFLTVYSFDSNYTRSNLLIKFKDTGAEHCVIIDSRYV